MPAHDRQLEHHRQYNQDTRSAWQWFASHRARVTSHLTALSGRSLAVWGAGNCNDLDLPVLLAHFERVSLFDLDQDSVNWGIAQQGPAERERIEVVEADAVGWGLAVPQPLPQFDVVASTCLLSQILHFAQLQQADEARLDWEHLARLRLQHIRLLLSMTSPGGSTLLFNDFLASDSCAELNSCAESELATLVRRELAQQNFFTGLNPATVDRLLRTSSEFEWLASEVHTSSPWRWRLGPAKCYAVCMHRICRA